MNMIDHQTREIVSVVIPADQCAVEHQLEGTN